MTKHKAHLLTIQRGLAPCLASFNALEQKFIQIVANKLKKKAFPLDQITRVILKNRIEDLNTFYRYNEVLVFINPSVCKEGVSMPCLNNIGVDWEDPSTVRHADGSVEFEFGKRIKVEELIINYYRLPDAYPSQPFVDKQDTILQKINKILRATNLEEIQFFASLGIAQLATNYLLQFTSSKENNLLYKMTIGRIDGEYIDKDFFHQLYEVYTLSINIASAQIEILHSYDPGFFPNPAIEIRPKKKKK